jgi:competence protein ComEC
MLSRAPFVSVVLFLATGILAGDALRSAANTPVAFVSTAFLTASAACIAFYLFRVKTGFTIGMAAWIILLGAGWKIWVETKKDDQSASLNALRYTAYTAKVMTIPEKRSNSIRFEVNAERFLASGKWISRPIPALLYLPDSLFVIPKPGDYLIIRGRLEEPAPPQNPEQFDYPRYLRNNGILFTAFLQNGSYRLIPTKVNGDPGYWPESVSEWADARFRAHIADSAAYGLVKAMLLGRRDDLQMQQVGDYIISGMHVAIIFLAISAAFGWLRRWSFGKWIYLLVMAVLLGFYGLVTGLPPSVQRAALMCMVLVMGEVAGRKHHSMNTLAFSALIILLVDPCALYDVGFQLSYLAMTGIFLLYEPICNCIIPSNRLLKFVWQVTALGLAAQVATFPLSLFYFHQFPTYFWLVNPLVITFTNILLPAALLLLVVSQLGVPWLAWLMGQVVSLSARLTDWSASIPGMLPGHLLENLHLNALEVILLYCSILLGWYTWHSRSIFYFKLLLVSVLLFVLMSVANSFDIYLTTEQVAYKIQNHQVVSFKSGNMLYVVSDKAFADDKRAFDFNVKNYLVSREIQRVVSVKTP